MLTEVLPDGTTIYTVEGHCGDRPYVFEDTDPERLLRIEELHVTLTAQVDQLPEPL